MGLEFIGRVIKTSLVISVLILIFGSFYYDWCYSLGIAIGLVFNCVNIWLIMELVKHTITPNERNPVAILAFSAVKFPILYLAGYLILKWDIVPVTSLLIGFTLLFGIIVLKVLGRQLINSSWMKSVAGSRKRALQ